ncbi:unnamed protein product [Pieris macdunnoughi]|uniref:Uncharacterized protein n=1 Tax=Pieris macdunnoughi TaxID=345717 RepID=A0A821W8M1_9NEOP|nr:unnamed protein product [Pieris macdunnoughi]
MEGPGMSLFKGAASIHINNSAQDRLEEQEELEDQKRRDAELKHKLANAFDDLQDDDEASSVNSSGNCTLDHTNANNKQFATDNKYGTGLLPTYTESINTFKEGMPLSHSTKLYCDTPKSHHIQHMRNQDEPVKLQYSPYGAGDGQNHYYPQEREHLNGYGTGQGYNKNYEQLKVMYEGRVKELEQYAAQMKNLDNEVESLRARLEAAIHDKDKAEFSLQEAHALLASSKHKTIELEQQVGSLTQKLMESDEDKEQLRLELRSANISLQEIQQRLHTMKVAHTHDTDALFREQQDRYREEMDRLQNDLMKAKSRLDEKDREIKHLEKRCMERDREKEEILIEKGATINRLANELEAAQTRLVSGETARLKEKVSQLTTERNSSREQVKELGTKLEVTAQELVLYRNKLAGCQREYENWRSTLNQILHEVLPDNSFNIGDAPSPGKLATLKEILSRYKLQIQKVGQLQEEINKRERRLEQHRKLESELRSKLEEQKGIELQLNSRIAVLQNKLELLGTHSDSELVETYRKQNEMLRKEMEDVKSEMKSIEIKYTELEMDYEKLKIERGSRASLVQEANADLLRELENYSAQLKDTLKENGELKTLYLQVCSARDSVSRELKDVRTNMQKERDDFRKQEKDYIERIEREKKHAEKLAGDLSSSREEIERANKRISELQKEFTDKQKEFTDKLNKYLEDEKSSMRKEMENCLQCETQLKHIKYLEEQLNKCNVKLAAQESNDALMKELKAKAEFFQNYIMERFKKIQDQRNVGTSTHDGDTDSGTEEVVPHDDMAAETALMMKEKAIRDQIAEKFTLEMKTVEMNCARRVKEIENEQMSTVTKLKELLERKAKEVDTLKEFILSERGKVTQILEAKENEISVLIKEHNELQAECQRVKDDVIDWKQRAEKYKERLSRLGSMEDIIKKEREDMKLKSSSSVKECQSLRTKLMELQSQCTQLEQKLNKLQNEYQIIQDKYKNAKKTVYTYKDYMGKKDEHINSEMSRIQDEYRKIFVKLQNQINYLMTKVHEERRGSKSQYQEYDCTEKIKKLNEDFARLTQNNFNGPDLNQ